MARLIWTPRALSDIQRLYRFLAPKNPAAAKRSVAAIRAGVKVLRHHPAAGRPVLDSEFRELPIPFGSAGYLVFYREGGADGVLLAVRHGREGGY